MMLRDYLFLRFIRNTQGPKIEFIIKKKGDFPDKEDKLR